MSLSAMQFALQAKQREIESLRQLADRIELIDLIGCLMHELQRERGLSSIFLASNGKRFIVERQQVQRTAAPVAQQLETHLAHYLSPERAASARLLSLMAWVSLDMDSLEALRARIDQRAMSAVDAVKVFSKIIGGLTELIFQLADIAPDPAISRTLVALVHVVQSKEAAGQERAVGGHMFAAGAFASDQQQRLLHLIDAQRHSLDIFTQFANPAQATWWKSRAASPHVVTLEQLRHVIATTPAGAPVDNGLSEIWFEATSTRIAELWNLQMALTVHVRLACETQIDAAQQALRDSETVMQSWKAQPPRHSQAVERFFTDDPGPDTETAAAWQGDLTASADRSTIASLQAMLHAQSARLSQIELELGAARRALHERKLVERAKHALMSQHGLSEESAFRMLQKAAMDQNRKLVEVAEMTLALAGTLAGTSSSAGNAKTRV